MVSNGNDTLQSETTNECAVCGAEIETDTWHIVTAETSTDSLITIRTFCSEGCRDRWEEI
ncbi:hypothetical protein EGH21_21200 [Halomicroarcula sp. F13]|uniref:Small CPxCG-related zinc finger protein n=1 Tax=Haloarcula rubra TaxID=2487747 RepID=A0AAW4PY58_9EURY|nr:hypothetical protein [Halomicroarcula rubra]MBX0325546.1 hypothetical protein [Halomicroarcula rubra]